MKSHRTDNGTIVAMCDSSLIEKVLKDNETELNIRNYSGFYKGELVDSDKAAAMLETRDLLSANIVGEESVKVAIDKGVINSDNVKRIGDVPYAHAFTIKY